MSDDSIVLRTHSFGVKDAIWSVFCADVMGTFCCELGLK